MSKLKVIESKNDAWEACLASWKLLSTGKGLARNIIEAKPIALRILGYGGDCRLHCPFCQYSNVIRGVECNSCPINMEANSNSDDCGCTVLGYAACCEDGNMEARRAFYETLVAIAKKDGYLPR